MNRKLVVFKDKMWRDHRDDVVLGQGKPVTPVRISAFY